MSMRHWMPGVCAAALIFCCAGAVSAQTAHFLALDDAYDGRFFDAATSAPDPADGNTLTIGFNSGLDPATWVHREFTASTAAFYRTSAMDTISFRIRAPAGYAVASVTYDQGGSGSIARTGRASGGTSWVVAGKSYHLGLFATNPTLTGTVDLSGQGRAVVPVSITTGLFAFSTPQLGSATLSLTAASVQVILEPLAP